MKNNKKILIAALFLATASSAQAIETIIDFEDQPILDFLSEKEPSLIIENVTFLAGNSNGGDASLITTDFQTSLDPDFSGTYLGNTPAGFTDLTLSFTNPVSQFSFNFGNNQNDWELTGFDDSGTLISTLMIDSIPVKGSNNGTFFGLSSSSSAFSYAVLRNTVPVVGFIPLGDGIEFDNLKYTPITSPIPEPSTYALMLGGLGMVGFMAYRRRKTANT